jgi:hypothetical protein
MKTNKFQIEKIGELFDIHGEYLSAHPHGSGHINDTFLTTYQSGANFARYIFQRINSQVFSNPAALMENFTAITGHIRDALQQQGMSAITRRVLTLVPSIYGEDFAFDSEGNLWRATHFIERTSTFDFVEDQGLAFEVGRCYGEYQRLLLDLAPETLHITIDYFHDTRKRYEDLIQAVKSDPYNRASTAGQVIEFAVRRESLVDRLTNMIRQGKLPIRVVHNDTKVNNLLIDDHSHRGICVTDLDTTMPGTVLYDFGDMVRTAASSALEDQIDMDQVRLRLEIFEPLARGYMSAAGSFLTPQELEGLVLSSQVIVFEIGMRFLSDYLEGDVYFKTERPNHNLDRCRTQFRLLESIEQQREPMERILESLA